MNIPTLRMFHYILTFLFTLSVVKTDPFPPSFSENIFTLEVPENQPIISQLFIITASDVDLPLVFEQISTFPEFEVTEGGILNLIQSLDRESTPSYSISIRVRSYCVLTLLCCIMQADTIGTGSKNITTHDKQTNKQTNKQTTTLCILTLGYRYDRVIQQYYHLH